MALLRLHEVGSHQSYSDPHERDVPLILSPAYPCRLWDLVPAPFTGTPQWYVLHAWAGSFQEMVASLVRELTPPTATEDDVKDGVAAVKAKGAALAVLAGFAEEEAVRGATRALHDPLANIYVWLGRCMNTNTPQLYYTGLSLLQVWCGVEKWRHMTLFPRRIRCTCLPPITAAGIRPSQ